MTGTARKKREGRPRTFRFSGRGIVVLVTARSIREARDQLLKGFSTVECSADEVWRAGQDGTPIEQAEKRTRKPSPGHAGAQEPA